MRLTTPAVLVCILALLGAGCVAQPASPQGPESTTSPAPDDRTTARPTATETASERIGAELQGLYTASNRTEYARTNDLMTENGSVRVVAVLRDGRAPPTAVGNVEVVQGNMTVMLVPIDSLPSLADHRNVTYLRAPEQPVADN